MQYYAIIGDVMDSRHMEPEEREQLQIRLRCVLEEINQRYCLAIAARFLITLGDEFQGLLYCAGPVLKIVEHIARAVYPAKLRYGIGMGELYTPVDARQALGADGPAYYRARDGVEILRRRKASGFPVTIRMGGVEDAVLDGFFLLLDSMAERWSDSQRECVQLMRQMQEQAAVAERLQITRSTVSRTLARAQYDQYTEALERIQEYLDALDMLHLKEPFRQAYLLVKACRQDTSGKSCKQLLAFIKQPSFVQLPARQQAALYQRCSDLQMQSKRPDAAAFLLQQGIPVVQDAQLWEETGVLWSRLASICLQKGDFPKAEEALRRAESLIKLQANPDITSYAVRAVRAQLFRQRGNLQGAINIYEELLQEMPTGAIPSYLAELQAELGDTLLAAGQYEKADQYLLNALHTYQNDYPDADLRISRIYEALAMLLPEKDLQKGEYLEKALAGALKNRSWEMACRCAEKLTEHYEQRHAPSEAEECTRILRHAQKRQAEVAKGE